MVIGNKADLEETDRAVNADEAQTYCQSNGQMDFLETSAQQNRNVEEAFHKLARQAIKRQEEMQQQLDASQQSLRTQEREKNKLRLERDVKNKDKSEKSGCC